MLFARHGDRVPASRLALALCAAVLALGAAGTAQAETTKTAYITSYGYNDNDDGSGHYGTAAIAYPDSHHSKATEGSGTYNDPITFATDPNEIKPHTMIYVPYLQKYFYMEDGCYECSQDWKHGKWHVDLWMGGNTKLQKEPNLDNCEAKITRTATIIINPSSNHTVDTTKMYVDPNCTVHLH